MFPGPWAGTYNAAPSGICNTLTVCTLSPRTVGLEVMESEPVLGEVRVDINVPLTKRNS